MKGRLRRTQLKARRAGKRAAAAAAGERSSLKAAAKARAALARRYVMVNPERLAPDGSYGAPDWVTRGYYLDRGFTCKDCGKQEVWRDTQQKWWYETARGGIWTTAIRCRPCRRRERERVAAARSAAQEGRARKAR